MKTKYAVSLIALMAAMSGGAALSEDASNKLEIEVKAQSLDTALSVLGQQLGTQITVFSDDAASLKAQQLQGAFTTEEALAQMLKGSGLNYHRVSETMIAVGLPDRFSKYGSDGFQKISLNSTTDYEASLGVYEGDENADEVDAFDLDEIIVTASRREQVLQDVPGAITTVNPIDFTAAGLASLDDVLAYTPGFNINKSGGPRGRGNIAARGVSQQGSTAVVGMYLDDMPLTSNGGFADGSAIYFDGLLGGEIERIELLKGPQGTLWGATAIGGAIRYVSKKPALETIRGGASVDLSSTKDGGFNQVYSGRLSMPIVEDRLGISVAGFYEDNGGLIDRVDATTGDVLEEDADQSETYGFLGDIYFKASDKFDIRAKVIHQKDSFTGSSVVGLADLDKTPTLGALEGTNPASVQDTSHTYLGLTLNYEFEWATLTASSSYVEYNINLTDDFTALFGGFADFLIGRPAGTTTLVPITSPVASEKYTQELRLTSQGNDSLEWMVGLYYADESTSQTQLSIVQPGDVIFFFSDFPTEYEEYAAFGNMTYYFTSDFDVTVGMRYSDSTLKLSRAAGGLLNGLPGSGDLPAPSALPTASDNNQIFLFTARYRPNDDTSLYARVASGYRPASGNIPIFDPVTGDLLTQEVVDQDNLWSYEVGAKGKLADGLLTYDIALYYLDWKELQSRVNFNGVNSLGNAADGITAKGFEGSFIINPGNGFTMTSNIAYSDSTLNSDEPTLNGLEGAAVPNVPKWTISSRANYDFNVSSDMTASVGAGFRYRQGSPSAFSDGDAGDSAVNIKTDSYALVDLNAGLYRGNVALNLYVTNLFNKKAFSNINASVVPGTTDQFDIQASPITTRTIGAVLSFNF